MSQAMLYFYKKADYYYYYWLFHFCNSIKILNYTEAKSVWTFYKLSLLFSQTADDFIA